MFTLDDSAIRKLLAPYGVEAPDTLCSQIRLYSELLLRWNQKIALTTVTDPVEIVRFHFGESLFASSLLAPLVGRLADLGSGAGFPGLTLSLIAPELSASLIESNSKKAAFLSEAVSTLKPRGVEVQRRRFEDISADQGQFEFVTARALGSHEKVLTWAGQMLGPGGRLALWVSGGDAAALSKDPNWAWHAPYPIPETRDRYILTGSPKI